MMRGSKSFKVGRLYISVGVSFTRFAIGFNVASYGFDLDLGFAWIGVEW